MNSLQQFRYFDKNSDGKMDSHQAKDYSSSSLQGKDQTLSMEMRKAKPDLLNSKPKAFESKVLDLKNSGKNISSTRSNSISLNPKIKKKKISEEEKLRDRELSLLAKKGDQNAFKELVLLYEKRLLSLAYSLNRNEDDAREIVQESLLKAWRNISSFKAESTFFTWAYRIVSNMSIDFSRKRYRQRETAVGEAEILDSSLLGTINTPYETKIPMGSFMTPEKHLESRELAGNIKKAIESLSPEHQQIIILREVEGLSYADISSSLGCSKGTVMSRLFHAREKIKKFFQDLSSN